MKKMMIVAATAAISLGGYAISAPADCGGGSDATCGAVVFKLTASGKTVVTAKNGEYKTVGALKISKGALAIYGTAETEDVVDPDTGVTNQVPTGACCYDSADLFATLKAGSATYKVYLPGMDVAVWSVFGKNLDKVEAGTLKAGSKTKLESALTIVCSDVDDDLTYDEDEDVLGVNFIASAFGSFTYALSKGTTNLCNNGQPCDPDWIPGSYSGWFAGYYTATDFNKLCFNCDCANDAFGGTWKAVYKGEYELTRGLTVATNLAGL